MSFSYNVFFVLIWSSAVLAIPTVIVLAAWLATLAANYSHEHDFTIVLLCVGVILLLSWTVGLRSHSPRVLIRSGAFPAACRGDAFPKDEVELRDAVAAITTRRLRPPTVIGGGWGWYLKRYGPPAPRVFTHHMRGRVDGRSERWLAGTTIAAVNKSLEKRGKTLPSHPTMDYIAIGAWIAASNHGNSADSSNNDESAIKDVKMLDMLQNTTELVSFKEARRRFSSARRGDYCVVDVAFNPVQNRDVQKRGIVIDSPEAAAQWLAPGGLLRMAFLGAARPHAVGLRWSAPYSDTTHRDPHCCQRFCQFFQVDVCSAIGGFIDPMSKFDGKSTLADANRWVPGLLPIMTIAVVLRGNLNFEVLFKLDAPLDGNTLFKLTQAGIAVHKRHGGRSEIRYGRPSANSVVFYDVSMRSNFNAVFNMLKNVMGVERCALHSGKYDKIDTAPLEHVSPYELEYGVGEVA